MGFNTRISVEVTRPVDMKTALNQLVDEHGFNIHEMRKQGYKVAISHRRQLSSCWGRLLTRQEYSQMENLAKNKETYVSPDAQEQYGSLPKWGAKNNLCATGGKTIVEVSKDGESFRGDAICSEKDSYNKKDGVQVAFHRLLGKKVVHPAPTRPERPHYRKFDTKNSDQVEAFDDRVQYYLATENPTQEKLISLLSTHFNYHTKAVEARLKFLAEGA